MPQHRHCVLGYTYILFKQYAFSSISAWVCVNEFFQAASKKKSKHPLIKKSHDTTESLKKAELSISYTSQDQGGALRSHN